MQIVGLTGGFASGKSTVAGFLKALRVPVVDADAVYHDLLRPAPDGAPSPLAAQVAAAFSSRVPVGAPPLLGPDGQLNRAVLGPLVFADADARRELERLTHPAVAAATAERFAGFSEHAGVGVYDVPLLYERGLEAGLAGVLVVWVPREIQLQRLRHRDGLTQAEAEVRLAAQLPLDEKKARADWILDNSGSREQTQAQLQRLWPEIHERLGG